MERERIIDMRSPARIRQQSLWQAKGSLGLIMAHLNQLARNDYLTPLLREKIGIASATIEMASDCFNSEIGWKEKI